MLYHNGSINEGAGPDKETSIELLHQAAETRAVNPKQVFTAITQLDKQKLSVSMQSKLAKRHFQASLQTLSCWLCRAARWLGRSTGG